MVKLIFVGKMDSSKTWEEFKKYYLEQHAPLFLKTIPYVKKYVVNLAIQRPGKTNPFDFITEIWWESQEDVRKFYKSEEYKNIIQPDEARLGATAQVAYFEEFVEK